MEDNYTFQETKAPFNMAIATLMSLRNTLDKIRDIESRIDYPPEERQRIKIELVKRFYVDSSPLINKKEIVDKYNYILEIKPQEIVSVNKSNQRQRKKIIYSFDINLKLDRCLLELQLALQKNKIFMPPSDDLGSIVGKMS